MLAEASILFFASRPIEKSEFCQRRDDSRFQKPIHFAGDRKKLQIRCEHVLSPDADISVSLCANGLIESDFI